MDDSVVFCGSSGRPRPLLLLVPAGRRSAIDMAQARPIRPVADGRGGLGVTDVTVDVDGWYGGASDLRGV